MKRILRLGLIIFMFILLTGCGTKISDKSGNSNTKGTNTDNSRIDRSDIESSYVDNSKIVNSDIESGYNFSSVSNLNLTIKNTFPSPTPASNGNTDWECGTFYSDISKENLETYLQQLMEDGWKDMQGNNISTEVANGTSEYTLSKGNNLLQIMTFLMDTEVSMCNSILIKLDENIAISDTRNRKEALSKSEAQNKIQDTIKQMEDSGEIPSTKRDVTGVFEIFIDDAFDKMNLQAFAAISDNGFSGCFLIRKNVVSYVPGNLDNTCVADIDVDGKYELIDLIGLYLGIFRYQLTAYDFVNPIYFSSLTEILHKKFDNCFVPNKGYAELLLKKVDNTTVKLVGDGMEYGNLITNDSTLVVENMEDFPFEEWSRAYDQSLLLDVNKKTPSVPPEILISIDGLGVDYEARKTQWNRETFEFKTKDAFTTIIDKEKFIPTFSLDGWGDIIEDANRRSVTINFGDYIPDSIQVYDAMLTEQGGIRYGDKQNMERTVKILDGSSVQFGLEQHMAFYLSSNSLDYEKDWYRMFRIVCKWGANECVYVFMINTGKTEVLTEIPDHQFLTCEGTYSALSSSWGLGLSIDSKNLPENYFIEWQVSDGLIRSWSETHLKPRVIMKQHNGYPMTSSKDDNEGAVIWSPLSFDTGEDVSITAYIYETAEDKSPIASSKIMLDNTAGVYSFSPTMQSRLADKLHLKEEDTSSINKSVSDNAITMSVVSSHVAGNTAVVMLSFSKDSDDAFGNCLNPDIEKWTVGNKTIENSMLISELSKDKKTLYCYLTWHTDEPLAGKTVTLNVEQLICNESQVIGKVFSDQIIHGKWTLNFLLKANTNNIMTGINLDLSKTLSMCGKKLQIDSIEIADLQVIVNTTTLSDIGKPMDPLSSVSTDSGMYYGVFVTVLYADGSQSETMDCMLDENNNIIACSFNTLTDKEIKEVHVKDVAVFFDHS
ncbi:MAG: hypothetical protein ACYDEX_12075 [Mobilitalea sp.]